MRGARVAESALCWIDDWALGKLMRGARFLLMDGEDFRIIGGGGLFARRVYWVVNFAMLAISHLCSGDNGLY